MSLFFSHSYANSFRDYASAAINTALQFVKITMMSSPRTGIALDDYVRSPVYQLHVMQENFDKIAFTLKTADPASFDLRAVLNTMLTFFLKQRRVTPYQFYAALHELGEIIDDRYQEAFLAAQADFYQVVGEDDKLILHFAREDVPQIFANWVDNVKELVQLRDRSALDTTWEDKHRQYDKAFHADLDVLVALYRYRPNEIKQSLDRLGRGLLNSYSRSDNRLEVQLFYARCQEFDSVEYVQADVPALLEKRVPTADLASFLISIYDGLPNCTSSLLVLLLVVQRAGAQVKMSFELRLEMERTRYAGVAQRCLEASDNNELRVSEGPYFFAHNTRMSMPTMDIEQPGDGQLVVINTNLDSSPWLAGYGLTAGVCDSPAPKVDSTFEGSGAIMLFEGSPKIAFCDADRQKIRRHSVHGGLIGERVNSFFEYRVCHIPADAGLPVAVANVVIHDVLPPECEPPIIDESVVTLSLPVRPPVYDVGRPIYCIGPLQLENALYRLNDQPIKASVPLASAPDNCAVFIEYHPSALPRGLWLSTVDTLCLDQQLLSQEGQYSTDFTIRIKPDSRGYGAHSFELSLRVEDIATIAEYSNLSDSDSLPKVIGNYVPSEVYVPQSVGLDGLFAGDHARSALDVSACDTDRYGVDVVSVPSADITLIDLRLTACNLVLVQHGIEPPADFIFSAESDLVDLRPGVFVGGDRHYDQFIALPVSDEIHHFMIGPRGTIIHCAESIEHHIRWRDDKIFQATHTNLILYACAGDSIVIEWPYVDHNVSDEPIFKENMIVVGATQIVALSSRTRGCDAVLDLRTITHISDSPLISDRTFSCHAEDSTMELVFSPNDVVSVSGYREVGPVLKDCKTNFPIDAFPVTLKVEMTGASHHRCIYTHVIDTINFQGDLAAVVSQVEHMFVKLLVAGNLDKDTFIRECGKPANFTMTLTLNVDQKNIANTATSIVNFRVIPTIKVEPVDSSIDALSMLAWGLVKFMVMPGLVAAGLYTLIKHQCEQKIERLFDSLTDTLIEQLSKGKFREQSLKMRNLKIFSGIKELAFLNQYYNNELLYRSLTMTQKNIVDVINRVLAGMVFLSGVRPVLCLEEMDEIFRTVLSGVPLASNWQWEEFNALCDCFSLSELVTLCEIFSYCYRSKTIIADESREDFMRLVHDNVAEINDHQKHLLMEFYEYQQIQFMSYTEESRFREGLPGELEAKDVFPVMFGYFYAALAVSFEVLEQAVPVNMAVTTRLLAVLDGVDSRAILHTIPLPWLEDGYHHHWLAVNSFLSKMQQPLETKVGRLYSRAVGFFVDRQNDEEVSTSRWFNPVDSYAAVALWKLLQALGVREATEQADFAFVEYALSAVFAEARRQPGRLPDLLADTRELAMYMAIR